MEIQKEMSPHVERLERRINRLIASYIENEMGEEPVNIVGSTVTVALSAVFAEQLFILMDNDSLWEERIELHHKSLKELVKVYRLQKRLGEVNESI